MGFISGGGSILDNITAVSKEASIDDYPALMI
jgi:hypothetical protein